LTGSGLPYRVYTPYSKNWLSLPKRAPLGKPAALRTPPDITGLPLPTVAAWGWTKPETTMVEPGERAARERLKIAIGEKIASYADTRNFPADDGTSRLSQDLRHGLLSIRTIYAKAGQAADDADATGRKNIAVFIKELAWREFYIALLHHYPNVLDEEFNADWRGLPWEEPGPTF